MKQTADQVHEKVVMLEKQTTEFRENTREDLQRIFQKLNDIHSGLQVLQAAPVCADVETCKRLEIALADQNRRLMVIEIERQKILGGKTILVTLCIVIGWAVTNVLAWFHKG